MLYLKNKVFTRWALDQEISDDILWQAINEFESGLFEANLGNHLYKKRIALAGKGKSSGTRTILFYQKDRKLIFCFGFNKNQQENLSNLEYKIINRMSDSYQSLTDEAIIENMAYNELNVIQKDIS